MTNNTIEIIDGLIKKLKNMKDTCDKYDVLPEPFQQTIFKRFCCDCFVYDSDPTSTIDQEMDYIIISQLFVTYVHYMLTERELALFKESLSISTDDFPPYLPYPYGSVVTQNIKTLQFAKISPLIFKLHELRLREDRMKQQQIDLLQ